MFEAKYHYDRSRCSARHTVRESTVSFQVLDSHSMQDIVMATGLEAFQKWRIYEPDNATLEP